MGNTLSPKPPGPNLPMYLQETLERQSPERLDQIAEYAADLASWKRTKRDRELEQKRRVEEIDEEEVEDLEGRDISTDAGDYEGVPTTGAYITVKETKPGYRYYYWQWREGDSWKNEYIAPVNPKRSE